MFDVPFGLKGEDAIMASQATADRTGHLGQIRQLARLKPFAEREAKAVKKLARNGEQICKAMSFVKLAGEMLAEAKRAAKPALPWTHQELEEARVANETLALEQAAFRKAIQHTKLSTVVKMTEIQVEGLEDNGVETFLRLTTVRRQLAQVVAHNALLRAESDSAKSRFMKK